MKRYVIISLLVPLLLLTGCGKTNSGRVLTSATGTIYECLVVSPKQPLSQESLRLIAASGIEHPTGSAYTEPITTTYDLVRAVLGGDMPCLPQKEPYFVLTNVSNVAFDDYLKPTRNILLVDINPEKYTQLKVRVSIDVWSHPQAVYRIQASSEEEFVDYWLQHGNEVRDWFVRQELQRQTTFYRANTNTAARKVLRNGFGCDMLIPEVICSLWTPRSMHNVQIVSGCFGAAIIKALCGVMWWSMRIRTPTRTRSHSITSMPSVMRCCRA